MLILTAQNVERKWRIENGIVQNPTPKTLQYGDPMNRGGWVTTYFICQNCGMIDGQHKDCCKADL